MKSWKTTVAGIAAILTAGGAALTALRTREQSEVLEFFTGLFTALLRFLQGLAERPHRGADSPVDRDLLRRGGRRISDWLRGKDGAGPGGGPDSDRP